MDKLLKFIFIFSFFNFALTNVLRDNIDERGDNYEGDIILTPGILESIKSGLIGERFRWPDRQLIYQISEEFTINEMAVINGAMDEIRAKTCIEFVQRSDQRDYVFVDRIENGGCSSFIGRLGGVQRLNLQPGNPGCITHGIAAHEFIHAIGFFHEQSRSDRDNYVEINWSNIQLGYAHNFIKQLPGMDQDYGISYDYNSIMHYSAYSFAADREIPTINTKPTGIPIGQRIQLSESDAEQINRMYCPERNKKNN